MTGTNPPPCWGHLRGMQGSPLAGRWVTPLRCSQRAVEMDVGCGRPPKARVHFWTPPQKGIGQAVRWLVSELEHMAQPTLLQAHTASLSFPPALCYFPFYPLFSKHGAVLGAWDAAGAGGRSPAAGCCGSEPHVLHPAAPVSAGCSSLAAGRSYSEPRSMGESRGLGDSHGRHVGRRAAGREEQVGFFRRIPHPSPLPRPERFQ